MSELSIVIPCFNEKSNIHEIVKQIDLINTKNTDLKIEFILELVSLFNIFCFFVLSNFFFIKVGLTL